MSKDYEWKISSSKWLCFIKRTLRCPLLISREKFERSCFGRDYISWASPFSYIYSYFCRKQRKCGGLVMWSCCRRCWIISGSKKTEFGILRKCADWAKKPYIYEINPRFCQALKKIKTFELSRSLFFRKSVRGSFVNHFIFVMIYDVFEITFLLTVIELGSSYSDRA